VLDQQGYVDYRAKIATVTDQAEGILSKGPLLLNILSQKIRPKADHT